LFDEVQDEIVPPGARHSKVEIASARMSCYVIIVEATRKRLEALLKQLEHATATADHTIAEVKAALQEMDRARPARRDFSPPAPPTRKRPSTNRAARKP
jgi:hypothetical protein